MANEFSTAGIVVRYAVEATAGTRPSSGYKTIHGIKSIGDMNPEPGTIQVTDLGDTVWHRYIKGLKDMGGNIALTANFTSEFMTAWGSAVTSAVTAQASSKSTWWEFNVPGLSKSFYMAGMPDEIGMPGVEVDEVFDGDVYIAPNKVEGWGTPSTSPVA